MALPTTLTIISIILSFLVLVVELHGLTPQLEGGQVSAPNGMCKSWVISQGYKCFEYEVKTADGYIVSIQRIPEGRMGGGQKNKQPVLLQHGLLGEGLNWVLNKPDQSLGFILADSGFDVWISNTRGTRYSRKHVSLDANGQLYWDWSWDQLAAYDFPAMVDFVYAQTGQKLHYVGHSLGTMVALASFSQRKVDKLKSAALLTPVAYLGNLANGLAKLFAEGFMGEYQSLFGAKFDTKNPMVDYYLKNICSGPGINCYDFVAAVTGPNCCLNASTFSRNEAQPTATKNMMHLAQNVRSGEMSKFDYGFLNIANYGQPTPPIYNLSNIPRDFPLFLSYGGLDMLADKSDVGRLLGKLKLHDADKLVVQYVKEYAHLDFVFGINAKDIVYNSLISFFTRQ